MSAYRNAALFLSLAAVWGTAFVAISAGLEHLPPVLFAGIRYDLAGVAMLLYAMQATDGWRPRTRADWQTVVVGSVLVIALYNALLFTGQQVVTSGVAAILVATSPIFTTGFSAVLLDEERFTVTGIVGLLAGFVGVGLVVAPDPGNLLATDVVASGYVLAAAAIVALGSVLIQRIDSQLSAEATVAWSCVGGAMVLHAISVGLPTESIEQATPTLGAVISVVYLAIFASALGYFIYFTLLRRVGAVEINLVSYAAPVFATVFGWLLLDERITATTVIGFLAITCGFVLLKHEALSAQLEIVRAVRQR